MHSMTGHGHAVGKHGPWAIDVEVRSVNNRFLKVTSKISEVVGGLESDMEEWVRRHVRRGSVHVMVRVTNADLPSSLVVRVETLRSYLVQAMEIEKELGRPIPWELGSILQLPGVLESPEVANPESLLHEATAILTRALEELDRMRLREGKSMADELSQGLAEIDQIRQRIEARAPAVLADYERRLEARVRTGLAAVGHSIGDLELHREILQFSDRCDIREELVRLSSHVEQFRSSIASRESQGRKLDFLVQEMVRETNTIGSKANDAAIAHEVVSIKTHLEQMREIVQNIE